MFDGADDQGKLLELQQLHFFTVVADREHFTKAAEDLHVSQPHLSRQVRALERELQVTLFERVSRRVQLTPAGQTLRERLKHVFDRLESACFAARAVASGDRGRLRVGFVGSVTYSWLPRLVHAFRDRYPEVEIEIFSEMLTGAQLVDLHNGKLDVGVLRPPIDSELHTASLHIEPLVAILPARHVHARQSTSIDLRTLSNERFITYADRAGSTTYQAVLDSCVQAGFAPRIAQTVDNTHTLVSLVAAGMGVALAPESTTSFAVEDVSYLPLRNNPPMVELVAAWRNELSDRPTVANFVGLAQSLTQ